MLHTGDYLTPYYATGEARFNKPIFNYWVIVGFFKTFGVNVFASRFGQLIAGAATLPIIYLLARAMRSTRKAAIVAVAIMAANIQLLNTSIRATTDIVQVFFLCVAMLGAARLLFGHSQSWRDRALLGIGAAFGILTKGGMPALFLFFVAAFTLIHRKQLGLRLRQIVNAPVLLVAVAPFAIWIGIGIYRHGFSAAFSFLNDQVASRLDEPVNPFLNLLLYGGSCLLELMPFTALLPLMIWHQSARFRRFIIARRMTVLFTLEWSLLIIGILIFGDTPRTRYMLLFYPLLAVMLGQMMTYLAYRWKTLVPMRRIIQIAILGIGLVGLAELLFGLRVSPSIILGGGLILLTAAGAFWICRHRSFTHHLAMLALVMIVGYRCQDIFIRGVMSPSPVPQLAEQLALLNKSPLHLATLSDTYYAPQIRLATGGEVLVDIGHPTSELVTFADGDNDPTNDPSFSASLRKLADHRYDAYLVPTNIALPLEAQELRVLGTISRYQSWHVGDYVAVTFGRKSARDVFAHRRQEYLVLARTQDPRFRTLGSPSLSSNH